MWSIALRDICWRWRRREPGERYILGGENLTLKQILDKLAAITGLPSPKVKLPYAVAYATGVVDTLVTGKMLQARAARHPRRGAHGPQEDVRHQRQGGTRAGMESAARWMTRCGARWSGSRRTAMPRKLVVPVVMAAMPTCELAPAAGRKMSSRSAASNGVDVFELDEAVVAVGGIGEKLARRAAEVAIEYAQPKLLLSAGIAGAISPKLKVGDVGRIREVVDVATGDRYHDAGANGCWRRRRM